MRSFKSHLSCYQLHGCDNMRAINMRWKWILFISCLFTAMTYFIYFHTQTSCRTDYVSEKQLKRAITYCNSPENPVSGAEGDVPVGYRLLSVHTVIRHGDRNTLHSLPGYSNKPVSCRFSTQMLRRYPILIEYLQSVRSAKGQRSSEQTFHTWSTYPNAGVCELGYLTPTGAIQHLQNGHFLRNVYKDLHLNQSTHVMVRTTSSSRTFQSAIALMAGLVPMLDVTSLHIQMAFNNSLCTLDTGHSCYCPGIHPFADTMANGMPMTNLDLHRRTEGVYHTFSELLPADIEQGPSLSHIMDVSMIHICHSVRLPGDGKRCMHVSTLREVYDIVQQNGRLHSQMAATQKIAYLKMQPLLSEISNRMVEQMSAKTDLKFVLYSGHDTSIDSLSVALNISDGHWPRYAARIVLELVSSTVDSKAYIRVLYDGEVVTHYIPFCQGHIVERTLCPFTLFQQYVKQDYLIKLTAASYKEACDATVL